MGTLDVGVVGATGQVGVAVREILLERGFPAGHATIANLSAQPWADTSALVRERNLHGIEVWSHGHDHNDPSPHGLTGTGGLVDQIVNSRPTIESWGVKCQGWMQPGATQLGAATPYGTFFLSIDDLNSYAGLLIRQNYPISEMYLSNVYRSIPTGLYHGLDHVTISDGMTYEAAVNILDMVVQRRLGLEVMVHAGNLGKPGNMTVAEMEQFLDHVVAYWDAGDLEVLTPSGLIFADRTDSRLDLVRNGSFESGAGWTLPANVEVSSGGRNGGNCLHFGPSVGTSASQTVTYLRSQRYDGETFLFEGWTRSTGGTGTSRVYLDDPQNSARLNLYFEATGVGTEWTRVRHAFTIPPQSDQLRVRVGHSGTTGGDWDDVTILKV